METNMPYAMFFQTTILIIIVALLIFLSIKIRKNFNYLANKINQLSNTLKLDIKEKLLITLDEKSREIQNTVSVAQLGFDFPLFLGGWSVDSFLSKFLIQHLLENPPKTVLELGSGSSTVLIARVMTILGHNYRHIAVDHDERYIQLTQQFLRLNKLEKNVDLWICPLQQLPNENQIWYSELKERLQLSNIKIDLLIVDGPPGPIQHESRFPALPMLYPMLNQCCTIILDDAIRKDEKETAEKWVKNWPDFKLTFVKDGHNFAILQRVHQGVDDAN